MLIHSQMKLVYILYDLDENKYNKKRRRDKLVLLLNCIDTFTNGLQDALIDVTK